MSSIYVQLAVLVLIFACFGFLLHAFYFGDSRQKRLSKELSGLQKELEDKEREFRRAEEAAQKSDKVIQSLEKQLQQKAVEMEHLKQLASRQDKAIEMLQKEAEAIRTAVSGSAKSVKSVQDALSAVAPVPVDFEQTMVPPPAPVQVPAPAPNPVSKPQAAPHPEMPPAAATLPGRQDAPAWKENLDNILSLLDTMEKEVDK